ncbi:hypothetical protein [Sulfuricurvum sp.]|uniref:hypothetical protein n=1 Tax=Sulfuricurvum sp. TaxID=2025608 RepID=UPI0026064601|nr:hypothetical protein [Sulfuricurvum sp.]MDD3596282.1 hypothetical protein [Sulfuricurvum sp.]MDD4950242.1 hypothetical protein [Sulfuricurvum sp.]
MYKYHDKSKRFLATALITTGLLGTTPLMSEEIIQFERSAVTQENLSLRIDSELRNQQFQCSKTGFILHFLTNAKAHFIHPQSADTLHADYSVHFNHSIAMKVYKNPSKHFDLMMHQINIASDGFSAKVNGETRYFQKV